MFLLNSQIPQSNSSSTLEPILLPRLQIHLAEFPYRPCSLCTGMTHGHLLRSRYDLCVSFSPELRTQARILRFATIHIQNLPVMLSWLLGSAVRRPRVTSKHTHTPPSRRLCLHRRFTPTRGKPSSCTKLFLLLLPRSAPTAPPHVLTHALLQSRGALLLDTVSWGSDRRLPPSIFSNV